VATGIDMLNPLDRTDGMDLAAIRERHPRLTLVGGGIDKSPSARRRSRLTGVAMAGLSAKLWAFIGSRAKRSIG
jgi:hypothetical protein